MFEMSIEEIKKGVEKESLKYASQFDTDYQEHAESDFDAGANHVLDSYYAPLEASHSDLLELLEIFYENKCDGFNFNGASKTHELLYRTQDSLSNAKKLINDTDKD